MRNLNLEKNHKCFIRIFILQLKNVSTVMKDIISSVFDYVIKQIVSQVTHYKIIFK